MYDPYYDMCCAARLGDCTDDFDGAALSYAVTGSPNYARQRPMASPSPTRVKRPSPDLIFERSRGAHF